MNGGGSSYDYKNEYEYLSKNRPNIVLKNNESFFTMNNIILIGIIICIIIIIFYAIYENYENYKKKEKINK
jgi:cell division protein FtsL